MDDSNGGVNNDAETIDNSCGDSGHEEAEPMDTATRMAARPPLSSVLDQDIVFLYKVRIMCSSRLRTFCSHLYAAHAHSLPVSLHVCTAQAVHGTCTDSFGPQCAVAADMPVKIISRAQQISRCRLEGVPIERVDADPKATEAQERRLAELVDAFLEFDFAAERPTDFFKIMDEKMRLTAGG